MTKRRTKGSNGRRERQVSVRGVRRNPPDLRKISRALAALAVAQVEAEAQAEAEAKMRSRADGDSQDVPKDAA